MCITDMDILMISSLNLKVSAKNTALQPTKEKKIILFIGEILQCRLNMKSVCSGHVDIGYLGNPLIQSVLHYLKYKYPLPKYVLLQLKLRHFLFLWTFNNTSTKQYQK